MPDGDESLTAHPFNIHIHIHIMGQVMWVRCLARSLFKKKFNIQLIYKSIKHNFNCKKYVLSIFL